MLDPEGPIREADISADSAGSRRRAWRTSKLRRLIHRSSRSGGWMLGSGTTLAFQPLASMYAASSSVIPTRAFALESKMESNRRAGMEKSLCGNGLFQGSIPPAPANQSGAWRLYPLSPQKCPPMAGFCELAIGLRVPKWGAAGAKSPIVSDGYLKYSRFRETATGDRVRSGLRDGRGSAISGILRYGRWSGRIGDN